MRRRQDPSRLVLTSRGGLESVSETLSCSGSLRLIRSLFSGGSRVHRKGPRKPKIRRHNHLPQSRTVGGLDADTFSSVSSECHADGETARERTVRAHSLLRKPEGFSEWLNQALPEAADREIFSKRSVSWLIGARRGRLVFPVHFPREVQALSKLGKSQFRSIVYGSSLHGVHVALTKSEVNYIQQVWPGGYIRTRNTDIGVLLRQQERTRSLPESQWPRLGTKALWPSSPTFEEMLEMAKRGKTPVAVTKVESVDTVKHYTTLAHFRNNSELCKRHIGRSVIGLRADISVPRKFLKHFRYRWNMLILSTPYRIPIELARFLSNQWARNLHNLWLVEKCSFKASLKKLDYTGFACITPGPW